MPFIIGLLIVFVVLIVVASRRKTTRTCRWRAEKSGDRGALRKYRCASCGQEAFTAQPGPPNKCLVDQPKL
ncbi:hypothetical protein E4Z66_13195 [Aliishimia ponticola]|uniref:Uncharacterized protein n=1 Tax=Aliishimia ponticola TaxID=2499833 RepID=A0A4S4N9T2_9RHOB|nr:hypothetical protein [Aliishimia ponticola]THH36016.1 hypothetical protein E4Z66_13195 [Aliishimia ponticola]